jgi:hypothetical protein
VSPRHLYGGRGTEFDSSVVCKLMDLQWISPKSGRVRNKGTIKPGMEQANLLFETIAWHALSRHSTYTMYDLMGGMDG